LKNFQDRFNRLDTISACDRQTDTFRQLRRRYAECLAGTRSSADADKPERRI